MVGENTQWQIVTTCKHDSYVFTMFRQMELFCGETLQEIVHFLSLEKEHFETEPVAVNLAATFPPGKYRLMAEKRKNLQCKAGPYGPRPLGREERVWIIFVYTPPRQRPHYSECWWSGEETNLSRALSLVFNTFFPQGIVEGRGRSWKF